MSCAMEQATTIASASSARLELKRAKGRLKMSRSPRTGARFFWELATWETALSARIGGVAMD